MKRIIGIRVFWDGKLLWTKNWEKIEAPQEFINNLPSIPIDGYL